MVTTNQQSCDIKCDHCGVTYNILADRNDIFDWLSGDKLIQDALAYLSPSERELLISNTCDICWKKMYGEDDAE